MEKITVQFSPAKDGKGFMTLLQGRVAFPERGTTVALNSQDEFEVMIAGENPAKTVYFLKVLRNLTDAWKAESMQFVKEFEGKFGDVETPEVSQFKKFAVPRILNGETHAFNACKTQALKELEILNSEGSRHAVALLRKAVAGELTIPPMPPIPIMKPSNKSLFDMDIDMSDPKIDLFPASDVHGIYVNRSTGEAGRYSKTCNREEVWHDAGVSDDEMRSWRAGSTVQAVWRTHYEPAIIIPSVLQRHEAAVAEYEATKQEYERNLAVWNRQMDAFENWTSIPEVQTALISKRENFAINADGSIMAGHIVVFSLRSCFTQMFENISENQKTAILKKVAGVKPVFFPLAVSNVNGQDYKRDSAGKWVSRDCNDYAGFQEQGIEYSWRPAQFSQISLEQVLLACLRQEGQAAHAFCREWRQELYPTPSHHFKIHIVRTGEKCGREWIDRCETWGEERSFSSFIENEAFDERDRGNTVSFVIYDSENEFFSDGQGAEFSPENLPV